MSRGRDFNRVRRLRMLTEVLIASCFWYFIYFMCYALVWKVVQAKLASLDMLPCSDDSVPSSTVRICSSNEKYLGHLLSGKRREVGTSWAPTVTHH